MKVGKKNLPSSVFCSLSDFDRASTELVTNTTYFPKIDLAAEYENISKFGGFPLELLPAILHETVHHWCFMAPIGNALSALNVRSHLQIIRSALDDNDRFAENGLNDYTKYIVASEILRPLNEGMSLFAEFDVMPYPETPVISKPLELIYFYFCHPDQKELKEGSFFSLLKTLSDVRCSKEFISRKSNLFLQPLSPDKGGYLPGYLGLKSLWIEAREKYSSFFDADLFYSFLKRYLYGDYGLVEALLWDAPNFSNWLLNFCQYLVTRIDNFLKLNFEKEVKIFIESQLREQPMIRKSEIIYLSQSPPIGIDEKLDKKGRHDLEQLIQDTQNASGESARVIRTLELQTLSARHLLWIGQAAVDLAFKKNNKVEVFAGGKKLFEETSLTLLTEIPAQARLDHYISVYQYFSATVITANKTTIAVRILGTITKEEKELFMNVMANERSEIEKISAMNKELFGIFLHSVNADATMKEYLDIANKLIKGIYTDLAYTWARFPQVKSVQQDMQERGLLTLLNNDVDFLEQTAALSVAASLRMLPEEAANILSLPEDVVMDVLNRLKEISENTGFPMVFGKKGSEMISYV